MYLFHSILSWKFWKIWLIRSCKRCVIFYLRTFTQLKDHHVSWKNKWKMRNKICLLKILFLEKAASQKSTWYTCVDLLFNSFEIYFNNSIEIHPVCTCIHERHPYNFVTLRVRTSLSSKCIIKYSVVSGKKASRPRYFVDITRKNILDANLARVGDILSHHLKTRCFALRDALSSCWR